MIRETVIRNILVAVSVAIGCFAVSSCVNEPLTRSVCEDDVRLRLVVSVPSGSGTTTRAGVDGSPYTDGTNDGIEEQRKINDAYVLVFDEDKVLKYVSQLSLSSQSGGEYVFTGSISPQSYTHETVSMGIVANLFENGVFEDAGSVADITATFRKWISNGYTADAIRECLVFRYPTETSGSDRTTGSSADPDPWDISSHHLPMYGEALFGSSGTVEIYKNMEGDVTASCGLYRAVAKLGFDVDLTAQDNEEGGNFTLQEIYVYYVNDRGYVISGETPDSNPAVQYTAPDVPADVVQFSNTQPIAYKLGENLYNEVDGEQSYYHQIYVPEAYHGGATLSGGNASVEQEPHLVVVVGGYYAPVGVAGNASDGGPEISYYRVDLRDTATDAAFDIVRNHSYLFHIRAVNNVGTSDPDPDRAVDGLVVEIEDYTEEVMRGINSQYTLTVNQSAFAFNSVAAETHILEIETDGTTWDWDNGVYYRGTTTDKDNPVECYFVYIVTDANGNTTVYDGYTLEELSLGGSVTGDGLFTENGYVYYQYVSETTHTILVNWLNIEEGTQTPTRGSFSYAAEPNIGIWELNRYACLYITAGSIRKQIQFAQPVGESASSVIITKEGTYAFNATERGNGGHLAETETGGYDEDINFSLSTTLDKDDIKTVGVIWETSDGLVTVNWNTEAQELFARTGCVKYTVNNVRMMVPLGYTAPSSWTGSVFDPGNGGNALIGAYDENNQLLWSWHVWVVPDYFNGVRTELWDTGYEFMDRNLGAYSNLPGSKSFGLLYQWGRKDPFIGAYREGREQDYHTVPKQYTRMYANPYAGATEAKGTDGNWQWADFDDSSFGSSYDGEEAILEYTVHNPTVLLDDGLLSGDHAYSSAHGLWGCESTDVEELEHGNKTMWDPCPEGYRVPTLNALTINDGYNSMWTSGVHSSFSCRYVPVPEGSDYRTGRGYGADFVGDAPFYGFWLDYDNQFGLNSGVVTSGSSSYLPEDAYRANHYNATSVADETYGWLTGYEGQSPDHVTWLPIAGMYNGSMEHFGRAGLTDRGPGGSDPYLPASSLHVTSVLWGNSPTANNSNYPGGLLLHGTEGAYAPHQTNGTSYQYSPGDYDTRNQVNSGTVGTEGEGYWTTATTGYSTSAAGWWTGSPDDGTGRWNGDTAITSYDSWSDENGFSESGRHFHSYMETNASVFANPSYAASVRCIVDKQRLNAASNVIYESDGTTPSTGKTYDLYQNDGTAVSSTNFELDFVVYSIESWQVSNPGAKWLSVSPLNGNTSDAYGNAETLKVKYNTSATTVPSVGEEAVITIKFLSGNSRTISIRYAGVYSGR